MHVTVKSFTVIKTIMTAESDTQRITRKRFALADTQRLNAILIA